MIKVAIIGTGITALSIAYHIHQLLPLTVFHFFEKSRRPGGRISTRTSRSNSSYQFNHGVPFLLQNQLSNQLRTILVDQLKCLKKQPIHFFQGQNQKNQVNACQVYRGLSSKIQQIPLKLHSSISSKSWFNTRIGQIINVKEKNFAQQQIFKIKTVEEMVIQQVYDYVFCCIPYPQIKQIKLTNITMDENLNNNNYQYWPTWTIMLASEQKIFDQFITKRKIKQFQAGEKITKNIFKCVKQQNQNQNDIHEQWVFYMSKEWSQINKNLKPQEVQAYFLNQLNEKLQHKINPKFLKAHRWLYSFPKQYKDQKTCIISKNKKLILTGDWIQSAQNIGQCWEFGKKVINQIQIQKQANFSKNESKL